MSELQGTIINSKLVPTDSLDEYYLLEDIYLKGSWRSVADITERDAIYTSRRKEGMVVAVNSDGKVYQLKGGVTNSDWVEFSSGGSISGDLSLYTLLSTTAEISGNLQGQIDAIVDEGTSIASSGGSILVTQNGTAFNIEVASAPIQEHNLLNGLQGGVAGEYFHLTSAQASDLIGRTEVASVSGSLSLIDTNLQSQISNLVSVTGSYALSSDLIAETIARGNADNNIYSAINSISGSLNTSISNEVIARINGDIVLQNQVNNLVSVTGSYALATSLSGYTLLSTTASISGDLQGQIDNIVIPDVSGFITKTEVAEVSGGLLNLISLGDLTLQNQIDNIISVTGDYALASDFGNYTLLTTTASISGDLQTQINNKQNNITLVAGSNVSIVENPTDTWMISASISGSSSDVGISGQNGISVVETSDNNFMISGGPSYSCSYYTTAGQSIPNNTWTKIVYGLLEGDYQNTVTTSSGVWYYTAPLDGYYLISAGIIYSLNTWIQSASDEQKHSSLSVWHETGNYEIRRLFDKDFKNSNQSRYETSIGTSVVRLSAGTKIHIRAYHTKGAALTLLAAGSELNHVNIRYLGASI